MSGDCAAEHLVLLLLELLDHVGAARQLVHHEGQGRGRGVVAGEHQRHQLVADLAVGEALAGLVADAEQQAEHVHAGSASGSAAPLGDLGEDDLVEDLARGEHLAPRRAGPAQEAQREVDPVEIEGALEVLGGGGPLPCLVGVEAEQGAHRDPHRQAAHPGVDVDDLALRAGARSPASPRRSSLRPRRRPARGGRPAASSPGRGRGSRRRSSAGRRRAAGSGRRSSTRASGSSPGGRR